MRRPLPGSLRATLHALGAAGICVAAFGLPVMMAGGVGLAVPTSSFEPASERPYAGFEAEPMTLNLADLRALPPPDPSANLAARPKRTEGRPPAPKPAPAPRALTPEPVPDAESALAPAAGTAPQADPSAAPLDTAALQRLASARLRRGLAPPAEGTRRVVRHRPPPCQDRVDGIDDIGEGHYRVERSVLDHYTRLNEALKLAAVAWHRDERGKIDGFSVYRIRCGNPLAQVGLRNGDVIHSINGKRVRSIPHAILVVAKVKRKDRIHVIGSRRGERLDIVAEVI